MKKIILILCFLSIRVLCAQTATGSWYGTADVELAGIHNNYLTELILKQKGDEVEGIFGYYFKDTYQSFFVHGSFNAKSREIIIRNIPIIYYNTNSTVNSIDCNMSFQGNFFASKLKSALKGYFFSDQRYKYTCPDLRVNYTLFTEEKNQDSILKNTSTSKKYWKPQPDDYIATATETKKEEVVATVSANNEKTLSIVEKDPLRDDSLKITESFKKRKSNPIRTLEVESDSVRLSFYDNGDVDGDSISVFMNSNLLLTHQELNTKAFNVYLVMDTSHPFNEISMFAENLGKYPPNTALMIVTDGINRYEVYMSSDMKQNATVRIKRKKPH